MASAREMDGAAARPGVRQAKPCSPLLKWAGGKTTLIPAIVKNLPPTFRTYYEPFAGGAALFFHLAPARALLGDANQALMETYTIVRRDTEAVIRRLRILEGKHAWSDVRQEEDDHFYYQVRDRWNHERQTMSHVHRAAAMLYLNRTCWNGLWRVNRAGEFNVPKGRYKAPAICDPKRVRACARALEGVGLYHAGWQWSLRSVVAGDLVYLDPPYVPVSATSDFTAYTESGFTRADQAELAEAARELVARGAWVVASNSNTKLVRQLYKGFGQVRVKARRNINSNAERRGPVDELLLVGRPAVW